MQEKTFHVRNSKELMEKKTFWFRDTENMKKWNNISGVPRQI